MRFRSLENLVARSDDGLCYSHYLQSYSSENLSEIAPMPLYRGYNIVCSQSKELHIIELLNNEKFTTGHVVHMLSVFNKHDRLP